MTDEHFLNMLTARQAYLQKELAIVDTLITTVTNSVWNKAICKDTRRQPSYILKKIMGDVNPLTPLTRAELRKAFNEYVTQNGIKSKHADLVDVFIAALNYLIRTKKIKTIGRKGMGTMLYYLNNENNKRILNETNTVRQQQEPA